MQSLAKSPALSTDALPSLRGRGGLLLRRVALAACVAVYLVSISKVAWRHEPWRDEADAWLVARDRSLPEVARITGYMGTPMLWYLVLMPAAKAGLSYHAMYAINIAFASAAVAILLFFAPLPLITRLLIASSYVVAYEYAVVARSYALLMLLLFTAAALWRHRMNRPVLFGAVLALLANTAVHGLIIAGAIALLWVFDMLRDGAARRSHPRRLFAGAGITAIFGMLAVLQLIPLGPTQLPDWTIARQVDAPPRVLEEFWGEPVGIEVLLQRLFWPPSIDFYPGSQPHPTYLLTTLAAGTLGITLLAWSRQPRILALFCGISLALGYVFIFKWYGGARHAGIIFLLFVFCLWIGRVEQAPRAQGSAEKRDSLRWARVAAMGVFHLGLLLSLWTTLLLARWDWRHPYSHAEKMAAYLQSAGLAREPIVATFWAESVLLHLPPDARFWYLETGALGTHNTWDQRYFLGSQRSADALIQRAETYYFEPRHIPPSQRWLLLRGDGKFLSTAGWTLVYYTSGVVGPSNEVYLLYRGRDAGGADGAEGR
jgi:hypothetical protein